MTSEPSGTSEAASGLPEPPRGDVWCQACGEAFWLEEAERTERHFPRTAYGQDPTEYRWQCPHCWTWLEDTDMEDSP